MLSAFILIVGPTGVGKSTLVDATVKQLRQSRRQAVHLRLWTTRPPREHDPFRKCISAEAYEAKRPELVCASTGYQYEYGIEKTDMLEAKKNGQLMLTDGHVGQIQTVRAACEDMDIPCHVVMLTPENIINWRERIDGDSDRHHRIDEDQLQVDDIVKGVYDGQYDQRLSGACNPQENAEKIIETVLPKLHQRNQARLKGVILNITGSNGAQNSGTAPGAHP